MLIHVAEIICSHRLIWLYVIDDKITVFVASADEFYEQPQVANGATALLQEVFGDEVGLPTRSAIGVNVLPGNIPVEIEALVSYE